MNDLIKKMLEEDEGYGDITTNSIISKDSLSKGIILSKDEGVLAGVDIALNIFSYYDIEVLKHLNDGDIIKNGDVLFEFMGNSRDILLVERTVLNLLMRMSGVATKTNNIVCSVRSVNSKVRIAGTRKTSPALQKFDKQAIIIGGGDPHRNALDDMVLIKDNHIKIVGSPVEAFKRAKSNVSFSKKIEIEVETLEDALKLSDLGADIIMLDNMSVLEVSKTLNALESKNLRDNVLIEVSGGITEENIVDYAKLDVDIISLGALTHSTSSLDFSLDIV